MNIDAHSIWKNGHIVFNVKGKDIETILIMKSDNIINLTKVVRQVVNSAIIANEWIIRTIRK